MVEVNDIVQVNEKHNWVGALVHVTEVKKNIIQGFVYIPLEGHAYIRLAHDEYEYIGKAALTIK